VCSIILSAKYLFYFLFFSLPVLIGGYFVHVVHLVYQSEYSSIIIHILFLAIRFVRLIHVTGGIAALVSRDIAQSIRFSTRPRSLGHPWLVRWERSDGGLILILFGIEH